MGISANYLVELSLSMAKISLENNRRIKISKIEMPRRSDLPRSTDLHNTCIGNRKTGAIGVIITYGSLGTLKDRWNIWKNIVWPKESACICLWTV